VRVQQRDSTLAALSWASKPNSASAKVALRPFKRDDELPLRKSDKGDKYILLIEMPTPRKAHIYIPKATRERSEVRQEPATVPITDIQRLIRCCGFLGIAAVTASNASHTHTLQTEYLSKSLGNRKVIVTRKDAWRYIPFSRN
jgi:hypothetical protein